MEDIYISAHRRCWPFAFVPYNVLLGEVAILLQLSYFIANFVYVCVRVRTCIHVSLETGSQTHQIHQNWSYSRL